jgi:P-loop containing NTP hydrolase pore-1
MAKNLDNKQGALSRMGKAVEVLQEQLPNAAVHYSSATGISEPRNMVRACLGMCMLLANARARCEVHLIIQCSCTRSAVCVRVR